MDDFVNAHIISPKQPDKKPTKSHQNIKKNLKNMLQAYKQGNNDVIKEIGEKPTGYDPDEMGSYYSDHSLIEAENIMNVSEEPISTSSESSKSNISETKSHEDTQSSISEFRENPKSLSNSEEISIEMNNSISLDDSFDITYESSDLNSLNSLTDSEETSTSEPFDPDGELASKILHKLETTMKSKETSLKEITLPKKDKAAKAKGSKTDHTIKHTHSKKLKNDKKPLVLRQDESSDDSIDSVRSLDDRDELSSPYLSLSATDMDNQSLTDVIGDYSFSTMKNLPTEKQNTIQHSYSPFETETMVVDDLKEEDEVNSLVPELDEELSIEDLNISEAKDVVDESFNADESPMDVTENEDIDVKHPNINVYVGKNCFILVLKHPSELFIHGKLKLSSLRGTADIFGYTLTETPIKVYAPYCYFAHCVKTVENQDMLRGLFSRLTSSGLLVQEAEEIVTTIGEHDAIIKLSTLNSKQIDFVDNNFNEAELFKKRCNSAPGFLRKVADNLGCSFYLNKPRRFLEEKEAWEQVISCSKLTQSRGIVCGGKGTGKSTFLRYYVNRIIDNGPVLLIDLDPGQAEFTVPGNVSVNIVTQPLMGPNFTHLRDPEMMLNIGMINVMDDPSRYISAVKQLITFCRGNHTYRSMPWIVNTMGLTNHMGHKFITFIILEIQPTFLYQIDSNALKKKFEYLHPIAVHNLYKKFAGDRLFSKVTYPSNLDYNFIIERYQERSESTQKSANTTLWPREERYLNILSYFGKLLDIHKTQGLLDIVPYEVSLSNFNVALNVKIPEGMLTKVINGKIIALCQLTADDKGKVFTLTDKAMLCHGHGLIRGIDEENGLVYILTPVAVEKLNLVNTVLYEDWMPELRGLERYLPGGTVVPYRMTAEHQHRQLMFPPRRRFNPLQLLKMTRTT